MAEDPNDKKSESVEKIGGKLFGFIRKKVGSQEDAEDILQDVWYQFSRLINLDEIESLSGWLFRVARNRITDFYRKSQTESYDDWTGDDGELGWREILFGQAETAADELFKEIFWEELMHALDELPENQREVFVKTEIEGKKLREVSEELGENIKSVTSRKGYAVKHLRTRLARLYNEL